MKIEEKNIRSIIITDVPALDKVEVFLKNYEAGQGEVTIKCYGESWTCYWGSMGSSIEEFICRCDNGYLINKLSPSTDKMVYDYENMDKAFKNSIISQRTSGFITKNKARELWEDVENRCENEDWWVNTHDAYSLAQSVFQDTYCWIYNIPKIINHRWEYLDRILNAVREAIKELEGREK